MFQINCTNSINNYCWVNCQANKHGNKAPLRDNCFMVFMWWNEMKTFHMESYRLCSMIPFMFPIAYPRFFFIIKVSTVKCHSTHLSFMNICQREQVFRKLQIKKLFAPSCRERCSGRRSDRLDMRRCAAQDGSNMSFSDTNIILYLIDPLRERVKQAVQDSFIFIAEPKHLLLSTALFFCTVELSHPCHP